MRDVSLYLQDILDAMLAIEKFVEGVGFEEFKEDDKTSSAVVRKFEIIGEASRQVPKEFRIKYPQIPWKETPECEIGLSIFTLVSNMNLCGIRYRMSSPW